MTNAKHTPTPLDDAKISMPLKITGITHEHGFPEYVCHMEDDPKHLAHTDACCGLFVRMNCGRKIVKQIVLAVNSHAALLEACKEALLALNTYEPAIAGDAAQIARVQLKKAIAQAEGSLTVVENRNKGEK